MTTSHFPLDHFQHLKCVFGCDRLPKRFRDNLRRESERLTDFLDVVDECVLCQQHLVPGLLIPSAHGLVGEALEAQQQNVAAVGVQFEDCGHTMHVACHTEAVLAMEVVVIKD
jgi:hypothetical protein